MSEAKSSVLQRNGDRMLNQKVVDKLDGLLDHMVGSRMMVGSGMVSRAK